MSFVVTYSLSAGLENLDTGLNQQSQNNKPLADGQLLVTEKALRAGKTLLLHQEKQQQLRKGRGWGEPNPNHPEQKNQKTTNRCATG